MPGRVEASALHLSHNVLLSSTGENITYMIDSPPSSTLNGSSLFGPHTIDATSASTVLHTAAAAAASSSAGYACATIVSPACHGHTLMKRTSSPYDNKMLIDFMAALKLVADAKGKRLADKVATVGGRGNNAMLLNQQPSSNLGAPPSRTSSL